MKKLILGGVILSVAVLAGCASSAVPPSKAKEIPMQRFSATAAQWLKPCTNCGTLVVVRDDGAMLYAGVSLTVYVDHKKTANLWPGEKFTLYLPEGFHTMVSPHPAAGTPPMGFVIHANQTTVFRLANNGQSGGPYFLPAKPHYL